MGFDGAFDDLSQTMLSSNGSAKDDGIMNLISEQNYVQAIEKIERSKLPEAEKAYYKGFCYIGLEDYSAAIAVMKDAVCGAIDKPVRCGLTLAMCHLKVGNEQEAREILTNLRDDPDLESKKAGDILEKLDSEWRKIPWIK